MIKKSRSVVLLGLLIACVFGQACTQDRSPCLLPKSPYITLHFVHFAQDTSTIPVDTILPAAIISAVVKSDTILNLYSGATIQLTDMFSTVADSCKWFINPDTTHLSQYGFDTLTYYYTRQADFLSNACGFTYFYNIDSVRLNKPTHSIDSIIIENGNINLNANTENVKIYIHPDYF